jgi:hypothetical protein
MSQHHPTEILSPLELERQLDSRRVSAVPTAVEIPDERNVAASSQPVFADSEKVAEGVEGSQRKRRRQSEFTKGTEDLWKAMNPTLMLINSGSVARDHLASERTFLAYVRTSIAISSMGVGECPTYLSIQATFNQSLLGYV